MYICMQSYACTKSLPATHADVPLVSLADSIEYMGWQLLIGNECAKAEMGATVDCLFFFLSKPGRDDDDGIGGYWFRETRAEPVRPSVSARLPGGSIT